jgi:hypothetical protein
VRFSATDLILTLEDVNDLVGRPVEMQWWTTLRRAYLFNDGISAVRLIARDLAGDLVADDVPCPSFPYGSDDWGCC